MAPIGIGHAPHTSSPLATMPVSRAPSPKLLDPPDAMSRTVSDTLTMQPPRRPSLQDSRAVSDSRADGLPIRGRSSSVHKPKPLVGMTSSVPPSAWQSRATSPDDDDDESEDEGPRRTKRRRSSAGDPALPPGAMISEDMRRQLDRIFEDYLQKLCSDCES
jgi:hypothetical protein